MRRTPREEGQRWLEQATVDLKWCQHLRDEGAYYLACFLAQQVAEKALKAFLYAQGEEVVIGHSVRRLSEQAAGYSPNLRQKVDEWAVLDIYYIPTRYPNGLPDDIPSRVYNRKMAADASALAEDVVAYVSKWFGKRPLG
ncbi:MAG: HEPN domain-containing protein [Anaerolineae bacterium]